MSTVSNQEKTHCKHGHEFTPENTFIAKNGWRSCKICRRLSNNKMYEDVAYREKRRQYLKEWRTKKENKEKQRQYHIDGYERVRQIIEDAKNAPCVDCGRRYPHYVMDFDHVRGKKLNNVGISRSIQRTIDEIAKCDVVCANCHRERTWKNVVRESKRKE